MISVSTWSFPIIDKSYSAAIIGCGRIGALLEEDPLREKPCTHAGAYSCHPRINLIAGCDINPERLKTFQRKWNNPNVYSNYRDLLYNEKIDVLSIATEIKNHHEIVIDSSNHGIPVILCEKPIGLSLEKAHNMIQVCKNNGTQLIINHERRFNNAYQMVKKMVTGGEIGDIVTIKGKILTGSPKEGTHYLEEGGGPLLHDGTHLIDIIRYLTDSDALWVFGEMTTKPNTYVEETLVGMLKLKNGVNCLIEAGGKRDYFSFEVELDGTEGRIVIGNGILKWYKSGKSQYYTGFQDLVEQKFPEFLLTPEFYNEISTIVKYLDDRIIPQSTGEDGYKALETIYAMYYSAVLGNKIYLPLPINDHNPLDGQFKFNKE